LVGKDFEDAYSIAIKNKIKELQLENQVFLYGSRTDVSSILNQSTIGILTSESEGLPVALLEYGMHQLPVVVTSVGEMPSIISNGINGYLVSSHDVVSFNEALNTLISDVSMRNKTAFNLHQKILEDFSSNGVLKKYIHWLAQI
jgi:glycosyltransferase involved in cell wall biosynthesis